MPVRLRVLIPVPRHPGKDHTQFPHGGASDPTGKTRRYRSDVHPPVVQFPTILSRDYLPGFEKDAGMLLPVLSFGVVLHHT